MKKLGILLAGLGVFVFIGCSVPPLDVLLDSFEGAINAETVDYGTGQGSSLKVSADKSLKICGEQSIRLEYFLKPSSYMWTARGYNLDVKGAAKWLVKPEEIKWKKYNAVSMFMYGRNTGAVIAFDVKDAGGEYWRVIIDDDFQYWKEMVFPFSHFFPRRDWQPETAQRNEVMDFPLMSFQIEPHMPGNGVCNFDCVKIIKVKK
ncbi:MAG: carbohydrate binding domain-containing protein [Candidatus Omnitrophota bacterium]|nr:hypothetical protein [Candidatus Omnitrophota bacterium]